ncbi:aspartate kinase [Leadbetterella byssophila DSM 17132]|uniref:Aspartokinase n=1 Tax=Leadbetterella byssophila (strain DSM 17132 / JCM 16389 / KACC 11308 / NBRC 106382 / 4M15) TaxID=649349 RepID=E4RT44_LEAB4|nr:aspartate kinase [Leadbetterella byssophila]ADQ17752.1 aspartate kinase [Leadbetterella byssophila DSM 17132]
MQVWKFGGTSVGKPERMKSIRDLVTADPGRKIVVLSALSGSTNALLEIGSALKEGDTSRANQLIDELRAHYSAFVDDLFETPKGLDRGQQIISTEFNVIANLATYQPFTIKQDKELVAEGEILSTQLFTAYMMEKGDSVTLIHALDFMKIDEDGEPVFDEIESGLKKILEEKATAQIIVTQGFICRNPEGNIDNLKRGGSDYTASLLGGAITAEEIQIWTDIDGMHNNDPRVVKRTFPVRNLTFEEAAELAYFGAKILHPSTITPAKLRGVPVRLKNTMEPSAVGTLISANTSAGTEITAIAAKDNITAIYIHSTRMLNAYGFLKKVFDIFEKYKTPVDMITTSEVSVAVTIDNSEHLESISAELSQFAELEEHDRNQTIICVVGQFFADKSGIAIRILEALRDIPVRMISYGASEHNVSILVDTKHKNMALEALNEGLFTFED